MGMSRKSKDYEGSIQHGVYKQGTNQNEAKMTTLFVRQRIISSPQMPDEFASGGSSNVTISEVYSSFKAVLEVKKGLTVFRDIENQRYIDSVADLLSKMMLEQSHPDVPQCEVEIIGEVLQSSKPEIQISSEVMLANKLYSSLAYATEKQTTDTLDGNIGAVETVTGSPKYNSDCENLPDDMLRSLKELSFYEHSHAGELMESCMENKETHENEDMTRKMSLPADIPSTKDAILQAALKNLKQALASGKSSQENSRVVISQSSPTTSMQAEKQSLSSIKLFIKKEASTATSKETGMIKRHSSSDFVMSESDSILYDREKQLKVTLVDIWKQPSISDKKSQSVTQAHAKGNQQTAKNSLDPSFSKENDQTPLQESRSMRKRKACCEDLSSINKRLTTSPKERYDVKAGKDNEKLSKNGPCKVTEESETSGIKKNFLSDVDRKSDIF